MTEVVKNQLSVYFSYFYKHTQNWKEIIEKSGEPLTGLTNQAEQLIQVEKADVKEFNNFPDIKERLKFKILIGIEDELTVLNQILNELHSTMQELRTKLINLERCTANIDWDVDVIVNGTAMQPPLSMLLQMALEVWQIYNDTYQNISNAFKCLDVRNLNTIDQFKSSLNKTLDEDTNHVIALTQYCYNE